MVSPSHEMPSVDLQTDGLPHFSVVVTPEEEHRLLAAFLESIYLLWADLPSPALNGQTPRHAVRTADGRERVAAVINELERNDLAYRRTGRRGYEFNTLRAHVGL